MLIHISLLCTNIFLVYKTSMSVLLGIIVTILRLWIYPVETFDVLLLVFFAGCVVTILTYISTVDYIYYQLVYLRKDKNEIDKDIRMVEYVISIYQLNKH